MEAVGLVRRSLTPIFIVLVLAPPRVCTCEHAYGSVTHASISGDVDRHDPPAPHPEHGPCPASDPDCPCVQPLRVMAPMPAAPLVTAPAAVLPALVTLDPADPRRLDPLLADPGSGDPPLYLTGCSLRF